MDITLSAMITVRVTPATHDAFKELAYQQRLTINALATRLFIHAIDDDEIARALYQKRVKESTGGNDESTATETA